MGTWGAGNFDSDTAADYLSMVIDRLVTEIAEVMAGDPIELEPDGYWGVAVPCQLELLCHLARGGYDAGRLPDPSVIAEWRQRYLAAWDSGIDELGPSDQFKAERLGVLNHTFDQLSEAAARSLADRAPI